MARVFISYQQDDRAAAECVCAALESQNISCWLAVRDIAPGQAWATRIIEGLKRSSFLVLILSEHSRHSRQIAREVELADTYGLEMIILRIEDVQPTPNLVCFLANVQWLDAIGDRFDSSMLRLGNAIYQSEVHSAVQTSARPVGKCDSKGENADLPGKTAGTPLSFVPRPISAGRSAVRAIAVGTLAVAAAAGLLYLSETGKAEEAFRQGQKDYQAGHVANALADYNSAIKINNKFYLAYCRRAESYYALGENTRALADVNEALELNRSWTMAFRVRGDIYIGLRKYDLAIQDYTAAISISSPDIRGMSNVGFAYRGRAKALRALGRNQAAQQDDMAAKTLLSDSSERSTAG